MATVNGFRPGPWSVDGSTHPGELLRVAAYALAQASEGVVQPGDLKATQLSTPGTQVRMNTGAAIFNNRKVAEGDESYIVLARGESRVDVPASPVGVARSHLVCVRVEDPQFGGFTGPPNAGAAETWQYVVPFLYQNVPSNTTTWSQVAETYAAYAVARVDVPAGVSIITDSMIKDLRRVARPRSEPYVIPYTVPSAQNLISVPYAAWPPAASGSIFIPSWATKALVEMRMGGIVATNGPTSGFLRFRLGTSTFAYSRENSYDSDIPVSSYHERLDIGLGDTIDIPAALRGTTQNYRMEGHKNSNAGGGWLSADEFSQLYLKITFLETAA